MPKKRQAEVTYAEVDAEIACILDERRREEDTSSVETKKKKQRNNKRQKKKHEYLCAWTDGEDPQWVDAVHLEGTPALREWENAKEEADIPEIHDPPEVLQQKCLNLAQMMKKAKRPVFLLGAGISAPVLPTFRGKNGLWTKNAYKNKKANVKVSDGIVATVAHRGLVELEKAGYVHFVVTQNYDDLSVRSGFPESKLSELHGNIFKEVCDDCKKIYRREFEVELANSIDHETGRKCDDCGGVLRDCIIHFEESLPFHDLKMANAKFVGADLTIVLGSSLKVEPAASLPFRSKQRATRNKTDIKACIVNLQETDYDSKADLLIRGTCDAIIHAVAKELLGESWDVESKRMAKGSAADV